MPSPPADPTIAHALAALGAAGADRLAIGGLDATALAARFGTPLYVFLGAALDAAAAAVQQALGPRVRLLYSIKANPSLAVAARLRACGIGAEVASLGELHLALAAGHRAADLRFAGPGKTDREIAAAIELGIGCFHAESTGEIDAIAAAARARGTVAGIAVRTNLPQELGGARMRMGGRSSRFGIDEAHVPAALRAAAARPELRVRGMHVYGGTQGFDADAWVRQARALLERAAQWTAELGIALDEFDLGGGFGVPAYQGDPEFDLARAGAGLRALLAAHDRAGRTFFVELGRYLTAPCGVYLTRVVRCKTSGGERHAVLDGGLHHCAAAAGLGTVLRRSPLLVHAGNLRGATQRVHLGGPLCTPADQFGDEVDLPELAEGDVVAVLHAGAYGLSFSPHSFLSHPTPAEVFVDGGQARIVRARGAATDVLHGQSP